MKIALITGASSGLGIFFLEETIKIYTDLEEIWILAERGLDTMEELADSYKETVKVRPLLMDLSKEETFAELDSLLKREMPRSICSSIIPE